MTWADLKHQMEAAGVLDTDEIQYLHVSTLWRTGVMKVIRDGTSQTFDVDECFEEDRKE